MPKVMNRNALAQIRSGQKFPTSVDLKLRPEVVKASGASTYSKNRSYLKKEATRIEPITRSKIGPETEQALLTFGELRIVPANIVNKKSPEFLQRTSSYPGINRKTYLVITNFLAYN